MNCIEFRRRLGSDPHDREADMLAHRDGCPTCASARERALAFDAELERAMAMPLPEGLADRILLAQTTAERSAPALPVRRRGRRMAMAAALAASVALVAFGVYRTQQRATPLGDLVIEHVLHHEPHAIEARGELAGNLIGAAFASRGVPLATVPDGISYVHECPVGPYRTVHMVMPEGDGAISVVYVADPDRRERRDSTRGTLRAREVPMGNGALVMVAADTRGFERVEKTWRAVLESPDRAAPIAHSAAARIDAERLAAP